MGLLGSPRSSYSSFLKKESCLLEILIELGSAQHYDAKFLPYGIFGSYAIIA